MKQTIYRQGDVLIKATDAKVPAKVERKERDGGRVILAYGEVTGHAHALTHPGAELFVVNDMTLLSIKDIEGEGIAALRHEEHAKIDLPPGNYEIVIQREYQRGAIKNVAD